MSDMDPCPQCGGKVEPTGAPLFGWRCPNCRAVYLAKPKSELGLEELRALLALYDDYIDFLGVVLEKSEELKARVKELEELRQGDFELTRNLAEAAGIKITASNKCPSDQWEQFDNGVMALVNEVKRKTQAAETWSESAQAAYKKTEQAHQKIAKMEKWQSDHSMHVLVEHDEFERLEAMEAALVKIKESHEARSELFTSDADCAANLAAWAETALRKEKP